MIPLKRDSESHIAQDVGTQRGREFGAISVYLPCMVSFNILNHLRDSDDCDLDLTDEKSV